jgi:hypothetical protein
MIPMITLFLVSGSYYVMARVANMEGKGIAGGASPADTSAIAPSFAQRSPLYNIDQTSGMTASGAEAQIGKYNFQSAQNEMLQSASTRASSAQQSWQEALQQTYAAQWGEAVKSGTTDQFMESLEASKGQTWAHVNNLGARIESQTGMDRAEANKVAATAILGAGASVSIGEGGIVSKIGSLMGIKAKAEVSGDMNLSNESATTETDKYNEASTIAQGYASSDENRAAFASAIRADTSSGLMNEHGFTLSKNEQETLTSSATEMISAQEAYGRVSAQSQNWGAGAEISNTSISSHHGGYEGLRQIAQSHGLTDNQVYQNAQPWMRDNKMSYNQAMGVAALTMMQHGGLDAKMDAHRLATDAGLAAPSTVTSGAERNAGLTTPVGGTQDKVENANLGVMPEAKTVDERVDTNIANRQQEASGWREDVSAGGESFRADSDAQGGAKGIEQLNRQIAEKEASLGRDLKMGDGAYYDRDPIAKTIRDVGVGVIGTAADTLDVVQGYGHWSGIGGTKEVAGFVSGGSGPGSEYWADSPSARIADPAAARKMDEGYTRDQAIYHGALEANPMEAVGKGVFGRELKGITPEQKEAISRLTPLEKKAVETARMAGNESIGGRLIHINQLHAERDKLMGR